MRPCAASWASALGERDVLVVVQEEVLGYEEWGRLQARDIVDTDAVSLLALLERLPLGVMLSTLAAFCRCGPEDGEGSGGGGSGPALPRTTDDLRGLEDTVMDERAKTIVGVTYRAFAHHAQPLPRHPESAHADIPPAYPPAPTPDQLARLPPAAIDATTGGWKRAGGWYIGQTYGTDKGVDTVAKTRARQHFRTVRNTGKHHSPLLGLKAQEEAAMDLLDLDNALDECQDIEMPFGLQKHPRGFF